MRIRFAAMYDRLPPFAARLIDDHGTKALRYCGVSAINVIIGVGTLAFCHAVLGWDEVPANVIAWVVSTGPAYLLSRRWVWQQSGYHSIHREVLPFWIIALVGLGFSTLVVGIAGEYTHKTFWILVANLSAYGVVWVAKYVILDRVMWRDLHPAALDSVEAN
jgi:putative flippase GtrA